MCSMRMPHVGGFAKLGQWSGKSDSINSGNVLETLHIHYMEEAPQSFLYVSPSHGQSGRGQHCGDRKLRETTALVFMATIGILGNQRWCEYSLV